MDYKASAQGVLEAIGGRDNIVSAAHCATRLRLVIADNGKIDKEKLENVCFRRFSKIRIILMRLKEYMCRSGCFTPM